ncbi:MAG: alpha/beta fold hydrolase [Chloroflexota bacterium]
MRVSTDLSELAVTVAGEGEPVLFIHGGFFGGVFEAACNAPALRDDYRVIAYSRHGYGNSSKPEEPYTIDDVVQDALTVLRQAGGERGHIVAHSAGGPYALKLAMDYPDAVHTLTLMEPVLPTAAWGEFLAEHFVPAGEALANGDREKALDLSFGAIYGSTKYRTEMDPFMPDGWLEQAVADIDYLFQFESPALRKFSFGPEEAAKIRQPVFLLRGDQSVPVLIFHNEQMKEWVPHAEEYVVAGGNHAFPVTQGDETTRALASFLAKHPMNDGSTQ